MPFAANAVIRNGETTTLDLDVRWKESLAVHGRLVIDGKGAQGWTALVDTNRSLEVTRRTEPVVLDAEGRFAAPAVPGPARLVLRSPGGEEIQRVIDRGLLVGRDTKPVEVLVQTGTVRGSGHAPGASLRFFHRFDKNDVTYHAFVADGQGAFEVSGIPVGKISLQLEGDRGWVNIARARLVQGETLILD